MFWSDAEEPLSRLELPADIALERLARHEIPEFIAALARWHPDIAVGEEKQLLRATLYDENFALAGARDAVAERPLSAFSLRAAGVLAGAIVLECKPDEGTVVGRISTVAPEFRGRGLGRALLRIQEACARSLGARTVYGLSEFENRAQSTLLEKEGWHLCGVVEDSERRRDETGLAHHYVPEGIYMKVLVPEADLLWPEPDQLTPQTARLFRLLDFPGAPPHLAGNGAVPDALLALQSPEPRPNAFDVGAELPLPPREDGRWPDVALLTEPLRVPSQFRLRALRRADIPEFISALPAWFPDIVSGREACFLDPAFYDTHVALAGEEQRFMHRPVHIMVMVSAEDDGIAALSINSYDPESYTLFVHCGVIAPCHRGTGLGSRLLPFVVHLGRALGAETIMAWATLRHIGMQFGCERAGWRLWGLIPASERYEVDGATRYGFEALYGVTLVPKALSSWPPESVFTPRQVAVIEAFR